MRQPFKLRSLVFVLPLLIVIFPVSTSANRAAQEATQFDKEGDAFRRGLTALKDNRLDEALSELTEAERQHPQDALIRNFRGIVLVRLERNDQAEAEYHEAIRLDARLEAAYRNLGFLQWTEHQLEPARDNLKHSIELDPGDSFAHYYLGRVELDAQHYAPALRELETSKMPSPDDPDFLAQLAAAYIAAERRDDALKSLQHLATLSLNDAQALHVASLFLALHANEYAVATIQNLNQRAHAAQDSWLAFDLALVYLLSAEYEKAISQADRYNNALNHGAAKHESPDAWTVLGIAAAHLNQQERSVNALQHAATLAPGDEEHWLNLTRQLMDMNRYTDAISAVRDGLAANPKSYALRLRLGAAHLAAGHYADAEVVFRDLVAAGDPLPTGYVGLAQVLMRTGRAEEAAAELAAAEQKLGPSFLLSYFQGLAFDRAGKPQPAMDAFQKAVQLNPNNPEAHLSLGKTELGLGRANDAISELQETLRLDSNNEQAKRLLSKAYARAGDARQAATVAEAPSNSSANPETDLLGDFFVPQWQLPPER
jgi:tetratricopeptide (TPR) repeat protein